MNATEIKSCIKRTPELENLYTGGLQGHLNSIMVQYSENDLNKTTESLYALELVVS